MIPDKNAPHFRIERFIDPKTGDTNVHYMWKDTIIPKIKLKGKIADQLSGLTLIQKDLYNARRWIEQAQNLASQADSSRDDNANFVHATNRDAFDQAKAFFVAGLTFYAKAYTEAAGRRAQMQRDWLSEPFRETHDYYMDYRHNFAAHSGEMKVEYAESYILLVPQSRNRFGFQLATSRVQPDLVQHSENGREFIALIDHAISKVEHRYSEGSDKLINAALSRPDSFWIAASHGCDPVDMDATFNATRKRKR